jgi:alanyl-tRNA synthetase
LGKGITLPGDVAFKLYDTYGFPYDLTEESLRARGVTVDTRWLRAPRWQKQKAAARASWSGSGEAASEENGSISPTKSAAPNSLAMTPRAEGQVLALVKDGGRVMAANAGERWRILTNQTPFYGESGGQAGDAGTISPAKAKGQVTDTAKPLGRLHAHLARITEGHTGAGRRWT